MMKKTAQQRAGEAVLSRLVAEVDGANFSFSAVVDLLCCLPFQTDSRKPCKWPTSSARQETADHQVCWPH